MERERQCEICGKYKPLSEFSKSYPHRCKPCVAEQTRLSRKEKKMQPAIKAEIDWEQRRYEIAKESIRGIVLTANSFTDVEISTTIKNALAMADKLISELKKGGQDGQTAE